MLPRRDSDSHRHVALVRDAVEICALVAAGIWAIYVFVYTDRIEPFQKPLTLVVTNDLRPVGAKGNLLVVRLQESIRNDGQTDVRVLGDAETLFGQKVGAPNSRRFNVLTNSAEADIELSRAGLAMRSEVLYAAARRYRGTTPSAANNYLAIAPGETWQRQRLIYVPRGRYDSLELWSLYMVTKYLDNAIPLHVHANGSGVLFFPSPGRCDVFSSFTTVTRDCPEQLITSNSISLWPKV